MAAHVLEVHALAPDPLVCAYCRMEGTEQEIDAHIEGEHRVDTTVDLDTSAESDATIELVELSSDLDVSGSGGSVDMPSEGDSSISSGGTVSGLWLTLFLRGFRAFYYPSPVAGLLRLRAGPARHAPVHPAHRVL